MRRAWGLALLAAVAFPAIAADPPQRELSSRLDYTLPASRHQPVTCKPGDLERQPGRSLHQVFGAQWPLLRIAPGSEVAAARPLSVPVGRGALRGLPSQPGLVVLAILVDASGRAVRAEPLCATTDGYDNIARRLALRATYQPALVDGQPAAGVTALVIPFKGGAS